MFFNELDILELRLNTLNDVVDYFILSESTVTFSGNPKPLYFQENKERFKKFEDKIIHIVYEPSFKGKGNWKRENQQRDIISNQLRKLCSDEDLIINSDLDEIPNPEVIKNYNSKGISILEQKFYYYYFNCLSDNLWLKARIGTWSEMKKDTLTNIRLADYNFRFRIKNGGWHFSFIGDVDNTIHKIESFAHQEFNNDHIKSKDILEEKMINGKDIFNRGFVYRFVEIDDSYPKYIIDNKETYLDKNYIRRKETFPVKIETLKMNKKTKKPIFVVTHERSGTHLVINMINHENKGGFYSVGLLHENTTHDLENYKYQVEKDVVTSNFRENVIFKSHHQIEFFQNYLDSFLQECQVIYVKRDIKDVLLSYYKFLNSDENHKPIKNFPKFKDWIFMNPKEVGYKYFAHYPDPHIIIEPKNYIDRILIHQKGWEKYENSILTINYEDILNNYQETKYKIENYLGKKIVDNIPDIKSKELPNMYPNKGIIGAHKDYMDDDLIKKIDKEIELLNK
jgi:beta-1,4-mannosyl-glycoprotein beta-1,4-N-acetylglucosaminyltransferase